jgi:hypothetical protein
MVSNLFTRLTGFHTGSLRNGHSDRNMYFASRTAASHFSVMAANGRFGFLPPAAQGRFAPLNQKSWVTATSLKRA